MFYHSRKQRSNQANRTLRQKGQGLVEYALILALVALAVVVIIRVLEPAVANVFSRFVSNAPVAPPSLLSYTPPPTSTPTATIDPNFTPSSTPTATNTPLVSSTPTDTPTPTNTATNTPPPTATLTPSNTPPPPPNILFVVGDATNLDTLDVGVRTQLAALNPAYPGDQTKILVLNDSAAQTADANDKILVVISSSADSSSVGTKFSNVSVPVVLWKDSLYDDMGMTLNGNQDHGVSTGNQNEVLMINSSHVLAAGLSGTQQVYTNNSTLSWGKAGAGAILIARQTGNGNTSKHVIFAYTTGASMPGTPSTAPARRVGLFLEDKSMSTGNLTTTGGVLFSAAVCWAMTGNACP